MQIADRTVVGLHYVLTDPNGLELDASDPNAPLQYLHGAGNIIPGLEKALTGLSVGDEKVVNVTPEEAYGVREEALVLPVPRAQFAPDMEIVLGMQVQANTEQGVMVFTVVETNQLTVTLDGNHPLAGVPLTFDVKVASIREASATELQQGFAAN